MKSIRQKIFYIILLWCINVGALHAQAPAMMNYQGAARSQSGQALANRQLSLRITILNGSESGQLQYSETRSTHTNAMGLYSIQIGGSNALSTTGKISDVTWGSGPKFIKVEIDPDNGSNFLLAGTSQLLSVPYALYAENNAPGAKGETGPAGKSAYELWLLQGNSGTIVEFLNSLKGAAGAQGEAGKAGLSDGPAGGDLSGNYPNPDVTGLRGKKISPKEPEPNTILLFDGREWQPTTLSEKLFNSDKSIISAELDVTGGVGATLKDVELSIKDGAVTTPKLADGSVSPQKILSGGIGKILATDSTGKVSWQDKPMLENAGPWYSQKTGKAATQNQENIYQQGKVGIYTGNPISELDVRGAVRFGLPAADGVIGTNSAAFGQGNQATAANATAFGNGNIAGGTHSTVFGTANKAMGSRSTVFGTLTEVTGHYSTSFGSSNQVPAWMSTVMGSYLVSTSSFQTVMGVANAITTGDETMLQVGVGDQNRPEIRFNAVTVMKNGNVGLGLSKTAPNSSLQVFGSFSGKIRTISNGTVADDDFTVLLKGNISLPAPSVSNTGRVYHLVSDILMDLEIYGSFRLAGIKVSTLTVDGRPGSRGYTVQSDGTDWIVIGQI